MLFIFADDSIQIAMALYFDQSYFTVFQPILAVFLTSVAGLVHEMTST